MSNFNNLNKKDQYKTLWNELESWLKLYENNSDRHKILYDFINKIKLKSLSTSTVDFTINDLNNDKTAVKRNHSQINISNKNRILLSENA